MRIILAAWGMMFAALLLTWVFVRAGPGPTAAGPSVPSPLLAAAATGCLVAACAGLGLASRAADRGWRRAIPVGLLIALTCAAAAVTLEIFLVLDGRRLRISGAQGTLLLTMVAFHVMQGALGTPALAVLLRRALAGAYGPGRAVGIRVWARYWYAALVVWSAVALILYVL
jgi:heme/copper-type cytochrome/quinol oxidase subunit 3